MPRATSKKPPFKDVKLQDRYKQIIRSLYLNRLLTIDQVVCFVKSNSNRINDRLRELWAAGYINRPEGQRAMMATRRSDREKMFLAIAERLGYVIITK